MPLKIDPKFIKDDMATDEELASKADIDSPTFTGTVTIADLIVNGSLAPAKTVTPAGTTGDQTINSPVGTVNFAAGTTTLTVTNGLVTTNSVVICVPRRDEINSSIWSVTPANGSFTIVLSGPPDSELSVGFLVFS